MWKNHGGNFPMRLPKHERGKASAKEHEIGKKRLEDATASLSERSITGYAETACRRARMHAAPCGCLEDSTLLLSAR